MRKFYHPCQADHHPRHELHNGAFAAYAETPSRVASILAAIGDTERPRDFGMAPLHAVHDPDYLAFLQTAFGKWRDAGRDGDAIPYVWPVVARRPLRLDRIDALLGRFSFDATTPIAEATWDAAYWSAQSAIAAAQRIVAGDEAAFALCRPPGHHAGRDYLGGYCYLNTAAIAAQYLRDAGTARVAILDVDYHHGNGTQDIFWARGDVFFASIHADPATDYPFYWGHANERGSDAGEGATLNLPLPHGTRIDTFRAALVTALDAVTRFDPGALVVSFGVDTWKGDPISHFQLQTNDYAVVAADIIGRGWPTMVVMEGGYAVDALGTNVARVINSLGS